jgi:peptide/nickel transport system substrate-binding protein
MKKLLVTLLLLVIAFSAFAGGAGEPAKPEAAPKAEATAAKVIKNPDTLIRVAYGTVDSLDPAKAYDNVSGGCIQNVYENLIFYKGSSTEEFVPVLATQVPSAANGLITNGGKTYRFPIRKGVKFHSGSTLTPRGGLSFKRNLVTDVDGGPMWMLFEPVRTYGSRDDDSKVVLTWPSWTRPSRCRAIGGLQPEGPFAPSWPSWPTTAT